LNRQQPELERFITAASYALAADDPEARAKIAAGMLSMYSALLSAKLQADVIEGVGKSLQQYFPAK